MLVKKYSIRFDQVISSLMNRFEQFQAHEKNGSLFNKKNTKIIKECVVKECS